MLKFIGRRALLMLLTMLLASVFIFGINELAPGNIARNILGVYITPEQEESFLAQLGLDRPVYVRYAHWLIGSDWQARRQIGMPLKRTQTDRGTYRWGVSDEDGALVQWDLDGNDLTAIRRFPDGTEERVVENWRWQTDEQGDLYFWGVDTHSRAVKWVLSTPPYPTGTIDLRFSDGTLLSAMGLEDNDGIPVHPSNGFVPQRRIASSEWISREIELGDLAGRQVSEILFGMEYPTEHAGFPVQLMVLIRDVELVEAEEPIWRLDLGESADGRVHCDQWTVGGDTVGFEASTVDAAEIGMDSELGSLLRLSGSLTRDYSVVYCNLLRNLTLDVKETTTLRYSVYYDPMVGEEIVWTRVRAGWVRRAGGPMRYIPLQRGFVRGDPGESLRTGMPVAGSLVRRLRNSAVLAGVAFAIVIPLALVLGLIAGLNEGRGVDRLLSLFGLITTATPEFASGVILILIFASWLRILPGATLFADDRAVFRNPEMLVLPVLTLTLVLLGYVLRITRASIADVMKKPYMRTASLKGLSQRRIVFVHALRNALIAPITVIMLHVNWLVGGIVVVESIFGFPGLGKYIYDSALYRDVFAIQAGAMVMIIVAVGTQLVADIAYTFLNPRIRYN